MASMIPTVHSDGTGADELAAAYKVAAEALVVARKALEATAPNGRDFHPQGDSAYALAAREHRSRDERLLAVQRELEGVLLGVQRQAREQRRRRGA